MQALKVKKQVMNGQVVLNIPKEFGVVVEVIVLAQSEKELEFWNEEEVKNLGKTYRPGIELDNEDFSQW